MTGGGSKYSILLLLFLIHVNDSKFSPDLVEPMLANDTNVCLFVCLFQQLNNNTSYIKKLLTLILC